ncbi:MAG: hypothetical protein V4490_03605, partial [Pseudomonadota bacterium]
ARSLIAKTKDNPPAAPATSSTPEEPLSDSEKLVSLNRRLLEMQDKIVELSSEQKSSAELIQLLAEQNAQVVKAIDVLRVRTKVLVIFCLLLGIALAMLILRAVSL